MELEASPYFNVRIVGDVAALEVLGHEIRHPAPAAEFGADMLALVERDGVKKLLLDMGQVRYMSSTGFGVLVNTARKIDALGGVMKICNLHPDVAVGANIIGLGRVVETFASESEGLASF